MLLRSAPQLHYPITVTALLKQPDDAVEKTETLFSYTYKTEVTEGNKYGDVTTYMKDFPATVASPITGKISKWKIGVGDVIHKRGIELLEIEEPCSHEIQYGGLCVNCGQDMTEVDYVTTVRNSERAKINMAHGNLSLTISTDEANRLNEEAKRRLLASRKLTLVVDLDLTIIHSHVDRIIGEWMNDPSNPNYEALSDVKTFQLLDRDRVATYYVKMRPGTFEFLENICKLYECHVYTMGTRPYAEGVAKVIDPDRKIFGDRILSRDENRSVTTKWLKRLFPIDNKMVVIIDDRADVWKYSEHLVKVPPFEFYKGIGDINATFLPPRPDDVPANTAKTTQDSTTDSTDASKEAAGKAGETITEGVGLPPVPAGEVTSDLDIAEQLVSITGAADPNLVEEQMKKHEEDIENIILNSPLAKQQEEQDKQEKEELEKELELNGNDEAKVQHLRQRHAVLHNDDMELQYLEENLRLVHRVYYEEYDRVTAGSQGGRVAELRAGKSPKKRPVHDLSILPDVSDIMQELKLQALKGCSIVFSGIFYQSVDPLTTEYGRFAKRFGAQVTSTLNKRTTHLITVPDFHSDKLKKAVKHPQIKIVSKEWLDLCFSTWKRVDEAPFLIKVKLDRNPAESSGVTESLDELDAGIFSGEDDNNDDTGDELPTPTAEEAPNGDPVRELAQAEWDDINNELEEFMGTDFDDSDSESQAGSEGVQSDGDDDGEGQGQGEEDGADEDEEENNATDGAPRKRKLAEVDGSGGVGDGDGDESDASTTSKTGSKLQRRKKRALERVTSLTNVVNATKSPHKTESGLPSPETTGPEEEQANGTEDGEDGGSDLEAEMMAALGEDDLEVEDG